MGNTINDVGSWLYGKVWRPVEHELFNYQENVDQFVGNVVDWSPADINISDRAAAVLTLFASASPFGCEPQEESSKPAEDIGQSKDVAPEVSQKPKGWVFCAKSGVVDSSEDCHLNQNVSDKMSTCVYLSNILQGQGELEEIYYDHDALMSYLLGGPPGVSWITGGDFVFIGNKEWPQGFLGKGTFFSKVKCAPTLDPSWCKGLWKSEDGWATALITADETTWSAQVWFRQSPDLCWAVYETPCADESVCK